jgi:hypothetical protein
MTDNDDFRTAIHEASAGAIVQVRRQWNDFKIASYRIEDIDGLHYSDESGGVYARSPRSFVHGYVMCDKMLNGELSHSCSHGPAPHRIKVCLTKKGNEKVWPMVLEKLNASSRRSRSAADARAGVEALARGLRAVMEEKAAAEQRKARRLQAKCRAASGSQTKTR